MHPNAGAGAAAGPEKTRLGQGRKGKEGAPCPEPLQTIGTFANLSPGATPPCPEPDVCPEPPANLDPRTCASQGTIPFRPNPTRAIG